MSSLGSGPVSKIHTQIHTLIRTLIVDDEPLGRSNVRSLLTEDPEIEIVGESATGNDALLQIREKKPDLVFLDIQMAGCDGFDVLELLGADLTAAVVFVTAYDQYAVRAFDSGALDYLLKPFDSERFNRALDRAKEKIGRGAGSANPTERIIIRDLGQILILAVADVDWIEAADYYVSLHVGSKTHLLRRSLSELDSSLDPTLFCRIHRSTIVNLRRVKSLLLNENGDHDVLLEDGARLRLSRRYRKQLQDRLGIRHPTAT